jgi:ferrochelatase
VIGVLVMAYGGPERLEEVEPYLRDVRGGRATAPEILAKVRERYRLIGGRSPILANTRAQAAALEAALNRDSPGGQPAGPRFQTFVGMRHWHPYIAEALAAMATAGIARAVGLVMAPHYSRLSVGAYFERVAAAGAPVAVAPVERWGQLPGYLAAVVANVKAALARFPESVRASVPIVFTAHSLPERILSWGDPYCDELLATVAVLAERLGRHPHSFAFQSAALTPEPWLGPDAGELIARLAADGQRHVLIAPIGFVSEHVEILYDVDIALRQQAAALGMQLERIAMPATAPELIAGLAGCVRERAAQAGWLL